MSDDASSVRRGRPISTSRPAPRSGHSFHNAWTSNPRALSQYSRWTDYSTDTLLADGMLGFTEPKRTSGQSDHSWGAIAYGSTLKDGAVSDSDQDGGILVPAFGYDKSGEAAAAPKAGGPPKPPFSMMHEVAFVATICSAQLLTQAALGQAIGPLHIIGDSFGTQHPGDLSWYPAAYSLTVGTFILIAGRLGDMYGHKKMFIAGWAWFAFWSLIAGFSYYSKSQIFFDVCRALQGIGPAFLVPNALALFGRTYPPGRRKTVVFSLFGATAPSGFVIGAIFSGLIAERTIWPWAYWATAIVCTLVAAISYWVIPKREKSFSLKKETFDFVGSALGVAGLVLINVAWNQGPNVGWPTSYVYFLLIIGFMFLAAFAVVEMKIDQPLVPLKALSGDTGYVLACIAAGWSSFGIWIYYTIQFMEQIQGSSPLLAATHIVPSCITGVIFALLIIPLMPRLGPTYIMVIAMLGFLLGNILVAFVPADQTYWGQLFFAFLIVPSGMDMSFPAATLMLSSSVPKEHQGIAASLVATIVNYSISIGLGIAGTVETQVEPKGANLLRGFRSAWYTAIGLAGTGLLISLFAAVAKHRQGRNRPISQVSTAPSTYSRSERIRKSWRRNCW